jgi:hypothetical protein
MRIDRHAAAIIDDGQAIAGFQRDLDPAGMAGHGLVHGIVEHFGGQMMQRPFIRAAYVHARATPDRLKAFEHLDRRCIIVGCVGGGGCEQVVSH